MRNVEIKARVRDLSRLRQLAGQLSGSSGETLVMCDTFYPSANGRLKLRRKGEQSELIFYDRPDSVGPKQSEYCLANVSGADVSALGEALGRALGVRGQVKKTRFLYMVGQTRVHVDQVEGLGDFMELEVILSGEETAEEGQRIAEKLMKQLEVSPEDLVSCAYMDLLDKQKSNGK